MIQARELRIGNWVMSTEASEPTQIYALGIVAQSQCEVAQSIPKYEPIPLTEEWLLKFGFKKITDTKWNYKVGQWRIYQCNFIERQINNFGVLTYDYNGDVDGVANFSYGIDSVHQLQNLYFALTGEELQIKDV